MNTKRLNALIERTTTEYRKGAEVTSEASNGVRTVHIYAMLHESERPTDLRPVDVHFLTVGVDMTKAEAARAELVTLLNDYPEPERLAAGPSYIEIGARLGSQEHALRLFALGEALALWEVITPARLGITGPLAQQMAGAGYVMISGFKAP